MDLSPETLAKLLTTSSGIAALAIFALVWTTLKLHAARDKYETMLERQGSTAESMKILAEAQTKLAERNQIVMERLQAIAETRRQ